MPNLVLRFPAGRYHATPFGSHVNEGLVEWPPSPWRLLRALVATGYTKLGWIEVPSAGRNLLFKLASVLPRYGLPKAIAAHSRHYMPLGVLEKGREKTSLVIDAWARIGHGEIAVKYDVDLTTEETELLAQLVGNLSYLGRAESWVEGRLSDGEVYADVVPHGAETPNRPGWEQVAVLAPLTGPDYAAWRHFEVARALQAFPLPDEKKKPSKKVLDQRRKAEASYPGDLLECLQVDTAWLRSCGWSQPPGSQRVLYWRPASALPVTAPRAMSVGAQKPVAAALVALATPTGNKHALPLVTRTLPQAELLHRALAYHVHRLGIEYGGRELIGLGADDTPLQGHQHAHILPLDLDGDAHLDHILVWSPGPDGLGSNAQAALRSVSTTHSKRIKELRVAVAFMGDLNALKRLTPPFGTALTRLLEECSEWRSITPFVLPRYLKQRGRNSFEGQVLAELESRGLPSARVEVVPLQERGEQRRNFRHFVITRDFRRTDKRALPPPSPVGYDVRLLFDKPVRGPIALGYGSHFGLGLFGNSEVG